MFQIIAFALFISLVWLEITVFGLVGGQIGVLLTIIGVFFTAAIGIRLLRISGRATMERIRDSIAQGRAPLLDVADGAAIMFAAGLLLIPGYATDALGIILFVPGLRTVIAIGLFYLLLKVMPKLSGFKTAGGGFTQAGFTQTRTSATKTSANDADVTIEGDYKRKD